MISRAAATMIGSYFLGINMPQLFTRIILPTLDLEGDLFQDIQLIQGDSGAPGYGR